MKTSAAGLRVQVGRQAADVPAVAHREQGQDRDLRVLGGAAAEHLLERQRRNIAAELVPQRLGGERRCRQVERDEVDLLVVGQPPALVGEHLLGHHHGPERRKVTPSAVRRSISRSMYVSVSYLGCV